LVHTETSGVTAFFVSDEFADGRFPAPAISTAREPIDAENGHAGPSRVNGHRHVSIGSGQLVRASTTATR
jgi:hypothetical protein